MHMDFRPQQQGEHDFVYAARILRAAATSFDALMANGAYSLADLKQLKDRIDLVVHTTIDVQLDCHATRTTT